MATTRPIPAKGYGTTNARDYVCLVGDMNAARLLTAPSPKAESVGNAYFMSCEIGADITINSVGDCTIQSPYLEADAAKALATEFRRCLLDEGELIPERGKRYIVGKGSYVMLDRESAERTAKHLKLEITQTDSNVEVIHSGPTWALWSDNKITTSIGLPAWVKAVKRLSEATEEIITAYRGSDSTQLGVSLNDILNIESVNRLSSDTVNNGAGIYAPKRIEQLEVRFYNGKTSIWWLHTQGYEEGYAYDLYADKSALEAAAFPPPTPPVAPEYTAMTGQLWEPCVSCGAEPVYMPLHRCEACWPTSK